MLVWLWGLLTIRHGLFLPFFRNWIIIWPPGPGTFDICLTVLDQKAPYFFSFFFSSIILASRSKINCYCMLVSTFHLDIDIARQTSSEVCLWRSKGQPTISRRSQRRWKVNFSVQRASTRQRMFKPLLSANIHQHYGSALFNTVLSKVNDVRTQTFENKIAEIRLTYLSI